MSKAEERALSAYPPEYGDEDFDKTWDSNEQYREPYQEGYEQAEKDLALTWKDIRAICDSFMDVGLKSNLPGRSKEFYTAVLDHYNKKKETKC